MTEAELFALPIEKRKTLSYEEWHRDTLRTLGDMHETLEMEGFAFMGLDIRGEEGEEQRKSEVWFREIGG